MAAFVMIGLMTDLAGRGTYLFTVLFGFHIFNIVAVAACLIYQLITGSYRLDPNNPNIFVSVVDWLVTTNFVLLFYVLPLYIASRIREQRAYWEIPMAA